MVILMDEERDEINLKGDIDMIRLVSGLLRVIKAGVAMDGTKDEADVILTPDVGVVVKIDKRVVVTYFTVEDSIDISTDNIDEERKSDDAVIIIIKDVLNTLSVEAKDTVDVVNTIDWVRMDVTGKVPMALLAAFATKAPI